MKKFIILFSLLIFLFLIVVSKLLILIMKIFFTDVIGIVLDVEEIAYKVEFFR